MLTLPEFEPNAFERSWIAGERATARLISALWGGARPAERRDGSFLQLLVRLGWWQSGRDGSVGPLRAWRNRHLANYLSLPDGFQDADLARALHESFGLSSRSARHFVATPTGITHNYTSFRPGLLRHVMRHRGEVAEAFAAVARPSHHIQQKIRDVAEIVFRIPSFTGPNGGRTHIINGVGATLMCLDPQGRFPMMNARTARLLTALGRRADPDGAVSLARLIGQRGIRNSFYLDVYASGGRIKFPRRTPVRTPKPGRHVGQKSEEDSVADIARKRLVVGKAHNALLNKFRRAVEWRYELLESEYDIVVRDWKPGRLLLIEAKPTTAGGTGRSHLRMAIGQLIDYRHQSFADAVDKVDLALLTLRRPEPDVLELLETLRINALWFEDKALSGTIPAFVRQAAPA